MCVSIYKYSINVIGTIVALERCYIRSVIIRRNYEDISVFIPVICSMSSCAISNGESWGLVANKLEFQNGIVSIQEVQMWKSFRKSHNRSKSRLFKKENHARGTNTFFFLYRMLCKLNSYIVAQAHKINMLFHKEGDNICMFWHQPKKKYLLSNTSFSAKYFSSWETCAKVNNR